MALRTTFLNTDTQDHRNDHLVLHQQYNSRFVFYPHEFGALANGTTDDTLSIQLAINAAAAVGGIVDGCGLNYRIEKAGFVSDLGGLENQNNTPVFLSGNYSLLLRGDNVTIRNMVLVLASLPELEEKASFIAIAVDASSKINLENITFDATALSSTDIASMSQSGESGCIHITNSFDFLVDSCIFKNGWGRNGVITVIAGCEHGYLTHCRFEASYNIPMWLDGFKNGFVSGNYFNHLCNGSIHIAANTDIIRMSERVQIYNNTMMSKNYAIALGGANSCLIVNNLISPVFGCSPILLRGASVGELTWDCFDNSFLGNTFIRQNPENGIYGKVFVLTGDIAHNRIVRNNYFHNNLIRGNWECGFYLEENSNYNEFTYNKISLTNGGVATGDSGGGGITGNVVSPNY